MTPGQPRTQLSAAERGETAVIVTSCGCYVVAREHELTDCYDWHAFGEHYQEESNIPTSSKDPQLAEVFDSPRDARERLRWHRGSELQLSGRGLKSDSGCKVCGTDEAKLGVLTAPPLLDEPGSSGRVGDGAGVGS